MATVTIRNIDAAVKERLRVRAARHGRSMEAEARTILSEAVAGDRHQPEPNLAEAIRGALRRSAASISSCRRMSWSVRRLRFDS
jgi:plasmid stability protein